MIVSYVRGRRKCRTPVVTKVRPSRTRGIRMTLRMPRSLALLDDDREHRRARALTARVARPARDELRRAPHVEGRRIAAAVRARGDDLLLPARRAGGAGADHDRLAALRPLERAVDRDLVLGRLELLLAQLL